MGKGSRRACVRDCDRLDVEAPWVAAAQAGPRNALLLRGEHAAETESSGHPGTKVASLPGTEVASHVHEQRTRSEVADTVKPDGRSRHLQRPGNRRHAAQLAHQSACAVPLCRDGFVLLKAVGLHVRPEGTVWFLSAQRRRERRNFIAKYTRVTDGCVEIGCHSDGL